MARTSEYRHFTVDCLSNAESIQLQMFETTTLTKRDNDPSRGLISKEL